MTDEPRSDRAARVDAFFAAITAQYGDRFDTAGEDKVRADIARLLDAADALRRWNLGNADEPDVIFQPVRKAGLA